MELILQQAAMPLAWWAHGRTFSLCPSEWRLSISQGILLSWFKGEPANPGVRGSCWSTVPSVICLGPGEGHGHERKGKLQVNEIDRVLQEVVQVLH